eukprot:Gb_36542 [translate_table: standard]
MDERSISPYNIKVRLIIGLFDCQKGFEPYIIGPSFIKILTERINHLLKDGYRFFRQPIEPLESFSHQIPRKKIKHNIVIW